MKKDYEHIITLSPAGDGERKRIIVFSPHPDDDVIAMGGTIHRLVEQGHEVHIAYQTSGNIAVCDEDVERYIAEHQEDEDIRRCGKLALEDADERSLLTIKGLVRRDEALAACTYNGIPAEQVHFLNMPFYETGRVEKNPLGEEDIAIIRNLLNKVKPQQIYMAGDFNDPHDTHRKCTEAIIKALREENACLEKVSLEDISLVNKQKLLGNSWLPECQIWLYNGAWDEWPMEQIDMAVPMTQEELMHKRGAILKHQSQMENAPYKGNDQRLFWQRSEQRNRSTAQHFAALGITPRYEAMEAFISDTLRNLSVSCLPSSGRYRA